MIASGLTATYDQPFVYNLATNTFVTLTGVTSSNVPLTQPTTGDWTPPTMALCGTNLVVTHPGFDGVTNFFGWFDVSNPAAPVWHAGNTAAGSTITFTTVPSWVCQFSGRAYFGVNPPSAQPSVVFTDSLTLKVTNAGQALTFGDNLPLTACGAMPLNNELGGIVQSLMVFKGSSMIEQIQGDFASSNITINTLNVATGTNSPRSICPTPKGLAFLAPDGIRVIDFSANVGDPIGVAGSGVSVPFLTPVSPSRVAAGCNAQVLRVSVENSRSAGTPLQEYWFDLTRQIWSGPHTFPATMYDVFTTDLAPQFLITPWAVTASLWGSKVFPDQTTSDTENGSLLQWVMQTVVLADNEEMAQSEITEMQVKTSAVSTVNTMNVSIVDQNGSPIAPTSYNYNVLGAIWGSVDWGGFLWGGGVQALYPRPISFPAPVVYNRMAVNLSGSAGTGFQIGDIYIRRRTLGYKQPEF